MFACKGALLMQGVSTDAATNNTATTTINSTSVSPLLDVAFIVA
jgi:hypothetical protein